MRIKEIELDNFKSFGKLTNIPLLGGFTTISGPNGSGKSNIVDSLLFALGLSSTRTMRAERLPDLLNNLSGRNECKVRVKFTNDAGVELEVTRRLKVKDSGYTSSYLLNGKGATLTEIHDELGKYNVSPTGYNVIMQGDVTGIVTMSATERRKIIDELAGVAEFDRRIDQAEKELLTVGEKIDHQRIVLAEIATRLEVLQSDRDHALKYLDVKAQKERLERDLIFVRVKDLEYKVAAENDEIIKLTERRDLLICQREELQLQLLEDKSEVARIDEEIKDKGGNEQILLRQELETKRGDLMREETKLSNLNGVIGEKTKTQKSLTSQAKTIEKHLSELTKEKKKHDEDLKATQLALVEQQGALQAVASEIEVLRSERDRSGSKGLALHDELQLLRDDRHAKELRRTSLIARKAQLEKELENARVEATSSIGKSAQLRQVIAVLERKAQDEQAVVVGITRSIRQMEAEGESTEDEIEHKRKELEQVNRKLIELETRKDVAGEFGWGRAVESVLNSGIRGVHGTIGQLGRVDGKYETALEIAIGGRLGHVVVDDDSVADHCITLLKQQRAGRATFVPLNKIQVQPPGLLPQRQGVIDFAYNLVDFSPNFTKAFQYACGQTIVLDTLENARRLIGTARMVTVDGELIEKYGTISGGGGEGKSKLHFSQNDAGDLGSMKQKSKQLSDDVRWLNDSLKELATALNQERNKLNDARTTQMTRQAELDARKKELENFEGSVDTLKPRLREMGDEVESIDNELVDISKAIEDLDRQITRLQDELSDLKAGGRQSQFDRLLQESEDLKHAVGQIEKDAKAIQREVDRIETEERLETNNRESLTQQIAAIEQEISDLSKEKPEHEKAIAELTEAIQELERKSAEISAELAALHEARKKLQEGITELEVKRGRLGEQLVHLEEEKQRRELVVQELGIQLMAAKAELEHILAEQPDFKPPSASSIEQLKNQIERLDRRMRSMEPVNMKALDEYNQVRERQEELTDYLETLTREREEIQQRIAGYGELKKTTFLEAFNAINTNFQEIFAELSHGSGRLELENPDDPFAGGLILRAQPRDKKMQRIEALSGGEKSLTALSFVFAFQRYAPAPFYAFDEVDMMLDGSNAERLARMVTRQSKSAQFVVVSLRRPMIENADHAIGVSLRADGFSKVVGISEVKLTEDEQEAARSA